MKTIFWLITLTLISAPVLAQNGTGVDAQENVFGATNINATLGHGGLTAGVSSEGDITVLSWPTPSLIDQLGYISSNDFDARDQPHFGAPDGAGLFMGMVCDVAGEGRQTSWFRDSTNWARRQDYGAEDGPNPHTYFSSQQWALDVVVTDAISPQTDTLVRQISITRAEDSTASNCSVLTYANLSPLPPNSRIPELPLTDWGLDGRNDFAAIWDADASAVIHFHPSDRRTFDVLGSLINSSEDDFSPIDGLLDATPTAGEVAAQVESLDEDYADGAYLMLTTVPAPGQFHIGFDETPFCAQVDELIANIRALSDTFEGFSSPFPDDALDILRCRETGPELVADRGWSPRPDPWTDAQDGELAGSLVAAGEVAESLRTPISFDANEATVSVVLGAGANLADARTALAAGTSDPAAVLESAVAAVGDWLEDLRIPGTPGSRPHTVAKRSLMNLRVGTDRETGGIVASIARQPPYYLDWPRDGAFFNVMLDASGQSELVDRRIELYAQWQRDESVRPTPILDPDAPDDPRGIENGRYPADAWEMNYFFDGTPGGTFRFEIDTTAFAVWTAVAHVGWVDDPEAYLRQHWSMIERGTDLLAEWRDPETGLHAPAQEDDTAVYSQTLHGAITVFGAVELAARAARLLDETEKAEAWEARALELREAIEQNFYSEEEDAFFMQESGRIPLVASGQTAVGPTAWLVWPNTLYPYDDPAIQRQLERDLALIRPALELEAVGGLYYMKNTISLAVAGRPAFDETIDALPELLANQATPDTHHFGEVMVVDNSGDEPVAQQRVSTPHLWEGSLYYLTVLAVEDPAALTRYDEVLPASRVLPRDEPTTMDEPAVDMGPAPDTSQPTGNPAGDGGCGCSSGAIGATWFSLLLIVLMRRRFEL